MPDKKGQPLKGEPGYETSARAKYAAKRPRKGEPGYETSARAKSNAKQPRKGDPGFETSARAKSNAKNNAKVQKRAREEATERISKMPRRSEDVLTPEAAFEVSKMIMRKSATAIVPPPILKVLAKAFGIDELS